MSVVVRDDLPKLNVPLLRDLVLWAGKDKANIDRAFDGWGDWEQSSWAKLIRNGHCRTSYCIAGQAVVQQGFALQLEGGARLPDGSQEYVADYCGPALLMGTDERGKPIYEPDEERLEQIETVGARVLGLEDDETAMFGGENTYETIVSMASYFARRRGLSMNFPPEVAAYDLGITDEEFEDFDEYCGVFPREVHV